ncbi:MAG: hypothetical protein M1529_02085 [Candidatus Thermoplasmatota archaeon]|jgi:hypothetical protein|nr:hypothetical protein [Candidatus Thermoplasmatota archaeon]
MVELICDTCSGDGHIDNNGHLDICPECFGLGVINVEDRDFKNPANNPSRQNIKKGIYLLTSVLAMYYILFFIFQFKFRIGIYSSVIILITGHIVAVGVFLIFLLYKTMNEKPVERAQ